MKRIIRATTDPAISEREKRNAALARRIGAEGIVLLENDGILPLKDKKVALYGFGARHTAYGGTGSGENRPRYRVSLEEGLRNAGYMITTQSWLDDFDLSYNSAHETWHRELIEGLKKCKKLEQMDYASAHPFLPPFGRDITEADQAASGTDTALYVLTRQAGEGADRKTEAGDYFILEEERRQLLQICGLYRHVVLLLNLSGVMDLSFLDELRLSAVVLLLQGGMEAGNAAADVLSGKVNPSGRLTDTWAKRYEDYPCHDTYSYRSGNAREELYTEGVFVGYRWFDANGITPRYPFGYGLSYTSFSMEAGQSRLEDDRFLTEAIVKNTGSVAGKTVAQLYVTLPNGKLVREKQSLAAFAKTGLLAPGETQTLTLSFPLRELAGYDAESSSWILEKGSYTVLLGRHSRSTDPVAVLDAEETIVAEICAPVCPLKKKLDVFVPDAAEEPSASVPHLSIPVECIRTIRHVYEKPKPLTDARVEQIVRKLSVKQKTKLVVGASYLGAVRNTVFGCGGNTTSEFVKLGVPNTPMTDGPQGMNVTPKSLKPKQNFLVAPALPETLDYGIAGWFSHLTIPKENDKRTVYYQYGTAWPGETVVAQTWDAELLKAQGHAIGEEMNEFGVVYWLGPAINIHRNPLCGRNYEYYSEDPLLTGKLAAAVTEGAQSWKGCYVTLKHFACNNLECERNQSDSIVDERTLREIYLKAFRIAIEEAGAKSVMASYNKINGVYSPNNYDLLINVLRCEWGFDGVVMTDWFAAGHDDSLAELCCASGCDLVMPGTPADISKVLSALKKGIITEQDIEISARRVILAALNSCVAE